VGIDVGTHMTRVVVGEFSKGEKNPKVIGIGESETEGLRHGYITDQKEAVKSLKNALSQAEKTSGIKKIRRAYVALGGVTLRGEISTAVAIISKADSEVTKLDINRALEECEEGLHLGNKKIIQIFPVSFRLDGKEVFGNPEGMHGNKLEVRALIITCIHKHLEELLGVLGEAGITPIDIIPGAIAGATIALSKKQKIAGSALVNIGSETTTLAVFENDTLISFYTFSIGTTDVTHDIALGLKISLEEAEALKLGDSSLEYSKKKLDEIIEARFSDIFELIENHLKKIKRSELLPAGVVFIGGGANTPRLEEFSKNALHLPSKVATTNIFGNIKTKLRDPAWFVALGLILSPQDSESYGENSLSNIFKDTKAWIKSSLKQLMP